MFNSENLQEKWQPVLEHGDLPEIKDSYKRAVTSVILENQEKALKEDAAFLNEAAPTNSTGAGIGNWDPILISLVRRAMPNLIAYDICAVQPMTAYWSYLRNEVTLRYSPVRKLFNEFDSTAGAGTHAGTNPAILNDLLVIHFWYRYVNCKVEKGDSASNAFAEMSFSIEKQP